MIDSVSGAGASDELRRFLEEQWAAFLPHLDSFQWPVETARWHELVYCLLDRVAGAGLPALQVRQLTDALVALDLADVAQLAALSDTTGAFDADDERAKLLLGILRQAGLSDEQAESALVVLTEAAAVLRTRHDGKIQRLLRHYGHMMVEDLASQFSFSRLPPDDARVAFTLWLQNVLAMPVELWDADVREVCRQLGTSRSALVATADDLDVNVALLDDVLRSYARAESHSADADQPTGAPPECD